MKDLKHFINEGFFSKDLPANVQAEKDKGYPETLEKVNFSVDVDNPYDEEIYYAYKSEKWNSKEFENEPFGRKVFALHKSDYDGGGDEYYIFVFGSDEHIKNINNGDQFAHLTEVSERKFKRFLKKFKHKNY